MTPVMNKNSKVQQG